MYPICIQNWSKSDPKVIQKLSKTDSKVICIWICISICMCIAEMFQKLSKTDPKVIPKWSKNGPKLIQKWSKGGQVESPGVLWGSSWVRYRFFSIGVKNECENIGFLHSGLNNLSFYYRFLTPRARNCDRGLWKRPWSAESWRPATSPCRGFFGVSNQKNLL